ncbi:hypothetical protein AG1IA_10189 [Rhizoctonia solani AG-1 IA]|uniref:Uncharacterized protein n=1 Tax=Thanatephorus cucumeris (strain AG1-IA) TaxID=983506 RepID=L8WCA5_THACA|nr:hypothetical protein AG1IA_10189 [Rhizoctonia solani AG-1 IA]
MAPVGSGLVHSGSRASDNVLSLSSADNKIRYSTKDTTDISHLSYYSPENHVIVSISVQWSICVLRCRMRGAWNGRDSLYGDNVPRVVWLRALV